MKIGLNFFPINVKFLLPIVRRADELGYESLWFGEHIVLPAKIESAHPFVPELGPPLPSTPLYDPLITSGYIAAQTERIKLGTSIYLSSLRHPIVAARLIATADVLANGRILLGVGVGWLKEEFEALDIPWEHRGPRLDENIHVMRRLWSEDIVEHNGSFYQFKEVGFAPKPVGSAVPILVGGESPAALRRAARIGDGWIGATHTPKSASARVRELRGMRQSDAPFEITVTTEALPTIEDIRRYQDAAVDRLMFAGRLLSQGQRTVQAMADGLEKFASDVLQRIDD